MRTRRLQYNLIRRQYRNSSVSPQYRNIFNAHTMRNEEGKFIGRQYVPSSNLVRTTPRCATIRSCIVLFLSSSVTNFDLNFRGMIDVYCACVIPLLSPSANVTTHGYSSLTHENTIILLKLKIRTINRTYLITKVWHNVTSVIEQWQHILVKAPYLSAYKYKHRYVIPTPLAKYRVMRLPVNTQT